MATMMADQQQARKGTTMTHKRKTFTKAQKAKIAEKTQGRCAYCGTILNTKPHHRDSLQIEHVTSIYNGGTNDEENLLPACRECNKYKSTYTVEQFRNELAKLPERLMKFSIFRLAVKHGLITINLWDRKFYYEDMN